MLVYGDPIVKAYDVAGHEFTHAVTSSESNLEYYGESGAINEALSDIMGTSIEKYVNNGSFNWTMGEQTGSVFRDMENQLLFHLHLEYLIQMITVNLMILTDGIEVAFILIQALLIKLRISSQRRNS